MRTIVRPSVTQTPVTPLPEAVTRPHRSIVRVAARPVTERDEAASSAAKRMNALVFISRVRERRPNRLRGPSAGRSRRRA